MRSTYLVCYDIADDKRLRKIFKLCRNWGNHVQFSVFECDLTPKERKRYAKRLYSVGTGRGSMAACKTMKL